MGALGGISARISRPAGSSSRRMSAWTACRCARKAIRNRRRRWLRSGRGALLRPTRCAPPSPADLKTSFRVVGFTCRRRRASATATTPVNSGEAQGRLCQHRRPHSPGNSIPLSDPIPTPATYWAGSASVPPPAPGRLASITTSAPATMVRPRRWEPSPCWAASDFSSPPPAATLKRQSKSRTGSPAVAVGARSPCACGDRPEADSCLQLEGYRRRRTWRRRDAACANIHRLACCAECT